MDIFDLFEKFRKWWFNLSISINPDIKERIDELINDFEYVLEQRDRNPLRRVLRETDTMLGYIYPSVEWRDRLELEEIKLELNRFLFLLNDRNFDAFGGMSQSETATTENRAVEFDAPSEAEAVEVGTLDDYTTEEYGFAVEKSDWDNFAKERETNAARDAEAERED